MSHRGDREWQSPPGERQPSVVSTSAAASVPPAAGAGDVPVGGGPWLIRDSRGSSPINHSRRLIVDLPPVVRMVRRVVPAFEGLRLGQPTDLPPPTPPQSDRGSQGRIQLPFGRTPTSR